MNINIKEKLNSVLLVDDDEATNYIHKYVIEKANCTQQVDYKLNGQLALDYLTSAEAGKHPQPDVIFLDINMPGMNGWEFLENYNKLPKGQQGKIVVVMLTTSLDPMDIKKSDDMFDINEFLSKPLTAEMLERVLKIHFPERF